MGNFILYFSDSLNAEQTFELCVTICLGKTTHKEMCYTVLWTAMLRPKRVSIVVVLYTVTLYLIQYAHGYDVLICLWVYVHGCALEVKYITATSKWVRWHLKWPASRLFTEPFIQVQIKKKHQSSVSLPFVQGIHRWPVNSPHKRSVTRKMFPFDDVIMNCMSFSVPMKWALADMGKLNQ